MNIATKLTKLSKGYAVRNINKKLPIKIGYGAFGVVYLNKIYRHSRAYHPLNKLKFKLKQNQLQTVCIYIPMNNVCSKIHTSKYF